MHVLSSTTKSVWTKHIEKEFPSTTTVQGAESSLVVAVTVVVVVALKCPMSDDRCPLANIILLMGGRTMGSACDQKKDKMWRSVL